MDVSVEPQNPARWRVIWAITRKEIVNISQNTSHLIQLGIPIFVSLVFLGLFPAWRDADELIVAVYDPGESTLVQRLAQLPEIDLVHVPTETAVFDALEEDATGGLILTPDFDTAVASGDTPDLTVYVNSEARSSNQATFQRLVSEAVWGLRQASPPAQITWRELAVGEETFPLFSVEHFLYMTLVALSVCLIGIGIVPQLLVEEKEKDALLALLASPANFGDVLAGKALAGFLIAWPLLTLITAVQQGWQGNWTFTIGATLLLLLFTIGIGLLLGLYTNTKTRCNAVGGIAIMLLNVPVWFAVTPITSIPTVPAALIQLVPTYYFTDVFLHSLTSEATWAGVGFSLSLLLASATAVYLILGWQVRRRETLVAAA